MNESPIKVTIYHHVYDGTRETQYIYIYVCAGIVIIKKARAWRWNSSWHTKERKDENKFIVFKLSLSTFPLLTFSIWTLEINKVRSCSWVHHLQHFFLNNEVFKKTCTTKLCDPYIKVVTHNDPWYEPVFNFCVCCNPCGWSKRGLNKTEDKIDLIKETILEPLCLNV